MVTKYNDLREIVQHEEKYAGCRNVARAPLIHEGFKGTFNLSFTEYDYMREFGNLSSFDKDYTFSTIQSCVRVQDIDDAIRNGRDLWKYLGVFEMADIPGAILLSGRRETEGIHRENVRKTIEFFKRLGLDPKRLYPSYSVGGSVAEITEGKYTFPFIVPEDTLSKDTFVESGVPRENLIADQTKDTFLALQIGGMKTPWGYRNELNYNIGTKEEPKYIDIGTLERCLWFPKYLGEEKASNINGLEELPHTFNVSAVGLERLCMCVNGLDRVQDVDSIKPFYDAYQEVQPQLTQEQRYKSGEVIRAMHRIQSDVGSYGLDWSGSRVKKRRRLMQLIEENNPEIDAESLGHVLKAHTDAQPWHTNLEEGVGLATNLILTYLKNKGVQK
jgi:hypothetical protein